MTEPDDLSLQERYAPEGRCFGCGPANAKGLRIRSFPSSYRRRDEVVADWTPSPHHEAFDGVLNGGIIGSLLDCHSNWTATYHLMRAPRRRPAADDRHARLRGPDAAADADRRGPVHLAARVVESDDDRATVEATLAAGGEITATCRGTFVAVKPGHPAYDRW